jgi:DNA repair protein RadB
MIPTGCGSLDKLLGGGLHKSIVHLFYGEAETGKTCLSIQCAVNAAYMGCKTIFIDSDNTFSPRRLAQIASYNVEEVAPQITLVKPTTFQEQTLAIDRLEEYLTPQIGLVVIDTATSLYSAEIDEKKEQTFKLNRELGRQLACLAQIAKTRKVVILVTSQVRNAFFEGFVSVEPVATRMLRFWSDIVINLKPTEQRNTLNAVLEKHLYCHFPANCYLSINEMGICDFGR